MVDLMPYQVEGVKFLRQHSHAYLADDAGLGKTRQVLASLDVPLLVVTTAAIRDSGVWQGEAAHIGWDLPMDVVSYHGLAAYMNKQPKGRPAVVFDEAHKLKSRQVTWHKSAKRAVRDARYVYLLSGTPVPNQASELWAQLVMLRKMPAYWPWVREWFQIESTPWSAHVVTNKLKRCGFRCAKDCEHWQEFHKENLDGYWLRRERDDVLKDLPPLSGHLDPMWTPMTSVQRKIYRDMKKTFLAELPDGTTLSTLTHSQRFISLWRMSTSVECAFPGSGLAASEDSSKLPLLRDIIAERRRPTFVVHWFRNTGQQIGEMLDDMNVTWVAIDGSTSPNARKTAVNSFQRGTSAVLLGSVSVVAEGLTLTAADEVVMMERSWVPSQNEQVIRRLHRIGQVRPVSVRQLVTPKSVDELQWKALGEKMQGIEPVMSPKTLAHVI